MASDWPAPSEGLVVELITPLTASGELDHTGLARLVERVVPFADALFAGGPELGESLDLPPALRRQLISRLLDIAGGRVPLYLGITGTTREETGELAAWIRAEMHRLSYPGAVFLADLPLWYHSNRGLPQWYQELWAEVRLPLILLNLPEVVRRRGVLFKHRNVRTQVFKKLANQPAIAGLIYRGEMRRFLNYHFAAASRSGLALYEADEANFLLRPGAWGVVSGSAQLFPLTWQRLTQACLHPEDLREHQAGRLELWDLSRLMQQLATLLRAAPAVLLKQALADQGVIACPAPALGTPAAIPELAAQFRKFLADLPGSPA